MDCAVVVLVLASKVLKNALSDLCSHVAIRALCGLRADLLVVKEQNHIDLCVVAILLDVALGVVND